MFPRFTHGASLTLCLCAAAFVLSRGGVVPASAQSLGMTLDVPVPAATHAVTDHGLRVSLRVDQSVVTPEDEAGHLMIDIEGLEDTLTQRPAVAMAIVIDTSGSMSGDKLANARLAAAELLHRLQPGDLVSLVSYADGTQTLLDNRLVGEDQAQLIQAIHRLEASGNTCISCGLHEARRVLDRAPSRYVRRTVLLSDGQANRGETRVHGLRALAEQARSADIVTSSIGLGHDYNESLMASIAAGGSGTFYFLPHASEIATIFGRELASLERTIARNVRITMETGVGVRVQGVGGQAGSSGTRLAQLAAGESRQFVYALTYPRGPLGRVVGVTVEWSDAEGRSRAHQLYATVERSQDLARVESSLESDVVERAEFVSSLAQVETAMEQAVAGDRDAAVRELNRVVDGLEERAATTGSTALQQEAVNLRGLLDEVEDEEFDASSREGRGLYLQNMARSREAASGAPRADMYHDSATVD